MDYTKIWEIFLIQDLWPRHWIQYEQIWRFLTLPFPKRKIQMRKHNTGPKKVAKCPGKEHWQTPITVFIKKDFYFKRTREKLG
jgi:hypothetical protein